MVARRWLLAILVLATFVAGQPPVRAEEVAIPKDCPPGDLGDWRLDPARDVAQSIEFIEASPAYMPEMCGAGIRWCCTWNFRDTAGKPYAVIYCDRPRRLMPPWFVDEHEACHGLGWVHGEWRR